MVNKHIRTDSLLENCSSGDAEKQAEALLELVEDEVYEALPHIIPLLQSPNAAIRCNAAYALGYLGIEEIETVGSALMNLLDDPEEIVRSDVVEALGGLEYSFALEQIQNILINDPSALVRASAAETLGYLGQTEAIKTLEQSLKNEQEDDSVRAYAANSIGLLGTPQVIPKLTSYLKQLDSSDQIKAEVLGAIYCLGEKEALRQLLTLLENADEDLAIPILNLLTDLQERKQPLKLEEDAPELKEKLTALAKRIPILRPHTEQILAS